MWEHDIILVIFLIEVLGTFLVLRSNKLIHTPGGHFDPSLPSHILLAVCYAFVFWPAKACFVFSFLFFAFCSEDQFIKDQFYRLDPPTSHLPCDSRAPTAPSSQSQRHLEIIWTFSVSPVGQKILFRTAALSPDLLGPTKPRHGLLPRFTKEIFHPPSFCWQGSSFPKHFGLLRLSVKEENGIHTSGTIKVKCGERDLYWPFALRTWAQLLTQNSEQQGQPHKRTKCQRSAAWPRFHKTARLWRRNPHLWWEIQRHVHRLQTIDVNKQESGFCFVFFTIIKDASLSRFHS